MKSFSQTPATNTSIDSSFNYSSFYDSLAIDYYPVKDAELAVRKIGNGPPLVFIHGYMVTGYTWRYLLPELSKHYTCYVVDSPGFGDSKWTKETDFKFTAHKERFIELFQLLNLKNYNLIAHDTGGSIARMIAIEEPKAVKKLILIDTEIPNHRPPFIRMFSTLSYFPFANFMFRQSLKSKKMIKSKLMFKEFYDNKSYLDVPENLSIPYLKPLTSSRTKMKGAIKYLRGIEWKVIDDFESKHKNIEAETLLVWGENDKVTFPINLAEAMKVQFQSNCKFVKIPNSKVMPHEENPKKVLKEMMGFIEAAN